MLSIVAPTLTRLRIANKKIRPLSSDLSSIYALQAQIELRSSVLRDIELIRSRLKGLLTDQGCNTNGSQRRPRGRRRSCRRYKMRLPR